MLACLQGNCTSAPPAPSALAPAVPDLKPRQCILYPGFFPQDSADYDYLEDDTVFSMHPALVGSNSILLDNLVLAAPENAGASKGALTMFTLEGSGLTADSIRTAARAYLRNVTLQGGHTAASDASEQPRLEKDLARWQGISMRREWRLFAEGALMRAPTGRLCLRELCTQSSRERRRHQQAGSSGSGYPTRPAISPMWLCGSAMC
jgi:hypothetical protein